MLNPFFADILLPLSLDKVYTYFVTDEFVKIIKPGFRVVVGLGKRKLYTGIVVRIHQNKPDFDTKQILSVTDDIPYFTNQQLNLINWITDYYCCSLGDVLSAAIPSSLIPSSETKLFYLNTDSDYIPTNSELKILDFLKNSGESCINELSEATQIKNPMKILENLSSQGLISLNQKIHKSYTNLYSYVIVFNKSFLDEKTELCDKIISGNNRQKEILSFIINDCIEKNLGECEYPLNSFLRDFKVTKSVVNALASKGLLCIKRKEISRIKHIENDLNNKLQLTDKQETTYKYINNIFKSQKPVLLHGITSSGKTEVYIKLIKEAIKNHKQVLYLLPEIAITSQIIGRLQKFFGDKIGVFHSKYSVNSRAEIYLKVLKSELNIVLGVRSAVFLPFSNLGLIIVDEEHESTYKQNDPDPRYNARDTSLVLANIHKSNIILGSATPSVESYFNTFMGKYALAELNERYGSVKEPEIHVADMKDAYHRKIMNTYFHPLLIDEINKAISKKQQIILFQNRRGYSPTIECYDCGWVPYCKNCNVSLTYHKWENKLVCHYCGEKYDLMKNCFSCKSKNLKFKGLGTERLEEAVISLFPNARVIRFDYDTANSRKKHEAVLKSFENHEYDILIGTQMVSKGFDFENVALVGILNADNLFNFPDFRAFERAYQLMAQVSGRAGRRNTQGKVIIQTFNPDHPVLQSVVKNDYLSLFNSQIEERKQFRYPPFWNFIIIKLKHKDKLRLLKGAVILADSLKQDFGERVQGPQDPLVSKVSNYYLLNIHLRYEKQLSSQKIKKKILEKIQCLKSESEFVSIIFEIDVDPI